ncbi:MAG: hypothetical protein Phog2KO_22050 [Phototrophicaceae bacterium]
MYLEKVDLLDMQKPNRILDGISLTFLEVEILRLVVEGYKNKEIAEELRYGVKYINKILGHQDSRYSLYKKIGAKNKVQAGIWYSKALEKDLNNRLNPLEIVHDDKELNWSILYRAERDLSRIFEISSQGLRQVAIQWTQEFIKDFTNETNKFSFIKYSDTHWAFYMYLCEAMYIWGCTSASIYTGVEPFNLKMKIAAELNQIGEFTNQQMPHIWAHALRGSAQYVEKNYRKAFDEMSLATTKGGLPSIWQSDILRTKLISASHMGMVDEVKEIRADIERLWYGEDAPPSDNTHHFMARDGIAKAMAILRNQDTWRLQEQSSTLINPELSASVQPLMAIGTRLDAMLYMQQPDKDQIKILLINAKEKSGQNLRHFEQITQKAEELLALCE